MQLLILRTKTLISCLLELHFSSYHRLCWIQFWDFVAADYFTGWMPFQSPSNKAFHEHLHLLHETIFFSGLA